MLFHGAGATPVQADFLDPIIEAKTAKFKMTAEGPGQEKMTAEIMVLAPSRMRTEREIPPNKIKTVMIMDGDQGKSLTLAPAQKLAFVTNYTNLPKERRPKNFFLDLRSQLLDARDRPDFKREPLGEKEIDGRKVVGFRLTGHGGVSDLWGDPKTGMPIRIELTSPLSPNMKPVILSDFVFNVEMDESLFSLEPPTGYKVQTTTSDASPAEEKDLVKTFRRYSQLSGGAFPDTLDLAAMMKFSVEHFEKSRPRPEKKLNDQQIQEEDQERLNEMKKLTHGIGFVFERLSPDANAHYAGKGVSLGAADTPIFWYRPKDSKKYRVIYADLSVREADTAPNVPDAQALPSASGPSRR